MPIHSQDITGLSALDRWISKAKDADPVAIEEIRNSLRRAAESAPLEDLIYIAEFHADMIRRHIAACVLDAQRNEPGLPVRVAAAP